MTAKSLTPIQELALAIQNNLSSPNVSDSNFEPANIVDVLDKNALLVNEGLCRVADAILVLAEAVKGQP